MDRAILLPFLIWIVLSLILLLFRRSIHWAIRITPLVFLSVYGFFWRADIMKIFSLEHFPFRAILTETVDLAFLALFWIWPLSLIYTLYAANDKDSSISVIALSIFTALVWGATWYLS